MIQYEVEYSPFGYVVPHDVIQKWFPCSHIKTLPDISSKINIYRKRLAELETNKCKLNEQMVEMKKQKLAHQIAELERIESERIELERIESERRASERRASERIRAKRSRTNNANNANPHPPASPIRYV
jgi:chromosome segregation ATPase